MLPLHSLRKHDIQRAHGALEQVGGAVARERLRDATEAFELTERQERDIEADYEAWKLLLDQMKQADAAQASNLGGLSCRPWPRQRKMRKSPSVLPLRSPSGTSS